MKKMYILLAAAAILSAANVSAQATISAAEPEAEEQVSFNDEVKGDINSGEFSSEAQQRAERAAIRKERNTLEFQASLNGSLSNFNTNWQTVNGSTNAITGVANMLLTHQYKKDRFVVDNKATAQLGYTNTNEEWVKSQDEWFVSSAPAYVLTDQWSVGGIVSLRSQFANGFDGDDKRTSKFFAPARFDVSLGVTYICPESRFPIKINVAPIAMNAVFVTSDAIRREFLGRAFGDGVTLSNYQQTLSDKKQWYDPYCYGLSLEDGRSRFEGGSSIQIEFDRTFDNKGIFRYRTTFHTFYGWINEAVQQSSKNPEYYEHIAPTVRWEHTIDIQATKFLTTQFYFQMYYNKAEIAAVQTKILLGVGLAYTFKNK